jgi:hypothetical protein
MTPQSKEIAPRGWTPVVARFSVPGPGRVIADLTVGSNSARESWYFFTP